MFTPRSLQQKMVLYLLLPVAFLLTVMGWLGFTYARDSLIREWQESAVLKLQRAAHQVDMRLSEPKLWMSVFNATAGQLQAKAMQDWVVQRLGHLQGVERASLVRLEDGSSAPSQSSTHMMMGMHGPMMMFERAEITHISSPHLDAEANHETISINSDLLSAANEKVGQLEVDIRFDYLIKSAISYGWKQGEMTSLIDDQGHLLACSVPVEKRRSDENAFIAVLREMKNAPSGTIMGLSRPDSDIIGYYRLQEAPWTLVLTARKSQILTPIKRFRNVFLVTGSLSIGFILLLIRTVAGRTVASIGELSTAARRVARGDYQVHLKGGSDGEIGQLIDSFNIMVEDLEERMRLKKALDLAMEVQQNLLPAKPPELKGLDIAGTCIYCDETGGDYYDFMQFPELGDDKIGIAIGDVTGHGIPAALLMTTARAMIRTRMSQPGGLAQAANDVNRLLCYDTERSGDFMTLFLAVLNTTSREVEWVRAGHTPAILYDWATDSFEELRGDGVALGFDRAASLKEYRYCNWTGTKMLFVGTDGIWETENPSGEQFGVERLRKVLRQNSHFPSQQIMDSIITELEKFREGGGQEDDIAMVVIKSC